MRTDVIQSLKAMWDALGVHQIQLLDDAVGPFLELVVVCPSSFICLQLKKKKKSSVQQQSFPSSSPPFFFLSFKMATNKNLSPT